MTAPPDPGALLRQMLGQWEQFANSVGGEALKTDAFARALHGAGAAAMGTQEAMKGASDRALAAANLPSRGEIQDLSARLARVEDGLSRIEQLLTTLAGRPTLPPDRPKPARTRTPPKSG